MSSSDSDSEAAAARKAKFAFALAWDVPQLAPPSAAKTEAKAAPKKPAFVGFQQPDFREIPKSLDTLMAEDWKQDIKDDVFGDSFVLGEAFMTTKVTRDDFYRRANDLSVNGLRMSAKEREEHRIAQLKGAKLLEKSLAEQISFVDRPAAELEQTSMEVDVDNGGIQMFVGTKTRITEVKAPEPLKMGLVGSSDPVGWNIKRSKRAVDSDDDSDSDSEESRKRKVAMAGVVVDFSGQGFTAPEKRSAKKEEEETNKTESAMDVDSEKLEKSTEKEKKHKKDKKDKKDKKHKKDKKDKKQKQEKSKKRKREGSNSDDSESD